MSNGKSGETGGYLDVTNLFQNASATLTYNDSLLYMKYQKTNMTTMLPKVDEISSIEKKDNLIHRGKNNGTHFNLHDSMAAIELMDSTMDCCEIPKCKYWYPLSFSLLENSSEMVPPRIIPDGLDELPSLPWEELDFRQARLICLEMVTRLESMLSGYGVAESIYTCLYAHDGVLADMRKRLHCGVVERQTSSVIVASQWCVYSASLILVKICDKVREIVLSADIYEEEDFTPGCYSFQFCKHLETKEVINTVESTILTLEVVNNVNGSIHDADVIRTVLKFQLDLFYSLVILSNLTKENVYASVKDTKRRIESCMVNINKLEQILETKYNEITERNDLIFLLQTFDMFVNRPLLGCSPIRKLRFNLPAKSIQILKCIYLELDWAVCGLLLKGSSLERIRRMLCHVSISSVNIVNRSLIVLNLYFDDLLLGKHVLEVLIADDMYRCGVPRILTSSDYACGFLSRLCKPSYDTLKVLLLNRNRQRAYIDTLIIKEWSMLQKEASNLDNLFRQNQSLKQQTVIVSTTNYILSTTIWLMEHYLSLGIELKLFTGHHDLATVYWYWDFLLSTHINITNEMNKNKTGGFFLERRMTNLISFLDSNNSKGKRKGRVNRRKEKINCNSFVTTPRLDKYQQEYVEDDIALMFLEMKQAVCRGIVRYFALLNKSGLLTIPKYKFTTHNTRFKKRFEIFRYIAHPPSLSYDDFRKGSDVTSISQTDLLSSTMSCFKKGKAIGDRIITMIGSVDPAYSPLFKDDSMNIIKVCIGNLLFIHKLSFTNKLKEKKNNNIEFDFQAHQQFCYIKIN